MNRLVAATTLVAYIFAASPAASQSNSPVTTVLAGGESSHIVCVSGANVVFSHPLRADGALDTRKLVVNCPFLPQGVIWIEGQPHSPETSTSIYLPLIGGLHE